MNLGQQILFFFSGLGVFNGLLMSGYFLLLTKTKSLQHRLFGLLILMLSLRIGKSVWYFFDQSIAKTILQFGLSAGFFIGPLLWLYIRSVQNQQTQLHARDRLHLLILFGLIGGVGFLFPYATYPEYWNPEIVQGIYAVWLGYALATGWLMKDSIALLLKPKELSPPQKWLWVVFGVNVLVCLVFQSILYLGFPPYIVGSLTFSFLFYSLLAFLIFFPQSRHIIEGEKKRSTKKVISENQSRVFSDQLKQLLEEKKVYEQVDLKLKHLADELGISPQLLSQFLNDNLGKGFSDYVNAYRIQAAESLLHSHQHLTIEAIGKEVGFRSKSSFYAAFKKIHGMTPAQFAKQPQEL